jgi:lysophospholipase L1-like esterase
MRRVLGTLAKLVAAGLATFLLIEGILLAFDDVFFGRAFYGFDPDVGFRVRSHARYGPHQANEFGFNDRDYPHERTPGSFRVLVLGDSFNWTFGPDGNYVGRLEERLQQALPDRRIEVVNAGYPQTHTGQQVEVLRKFGLPYRPDLVVLGFFTGNDFYDADPGRMRIVVGGVATDIRPGDQFYRILFGQPLVGKSRLALFAEDRWNELRRVDAGQREQFARPSTVERVRDAAPSGAERVRSAPALSESYLDWLQRRMDFARPSREAHFRRHENYVFESLLAMRSLLAEREVGLVVAAYPDAVQLDPQIRDALLQRAGRAASEYEWDRAQRLLRGFCAEHGIAFVDLLPAFRSAQRRGWALYLESDSHWNAAGNVLAAELLFDAVLPRICAALPGAGGACASTTGGPVRSLGSGS